jgi:hypothetical protein
MKMAKKTSKKHKEASSWPPTYTEVSKSGSGIHLHYFYTGDVGALASVYDVRVEVKTLLGDAYLRRKLTKCNTLEIATLTSGFQRKSDLCSNTRYKKVKRDYGI